MPEVQRQRTRTSSRKRRPNNQMRKRLAPVLNEQSEMPLCLLVCAMLAEVSLPKPTGSTGPDVLWSLIGGAVSAALVLGAIRRIRPQWTPFGRSMATTATVGLLFWVNLPGQFGIELIFGLLILAACLLVVLFKKRTVSNKSQPRWKKNRNLRRATRWVTVGVAGVLILSLGFATDTAFSLRESLIEASAVAEQAGKDLQNLEFERAANKLEQASSLLTSFDEIARGRGGRVLRAMPILGYQRSYLLGVANELRELARRSRSLVLQGPLQAFTSQNARLDLVDIADLEKPFNDVLVTSGTVAAQNAKASPWVWNTLTKTTTDLAASIQSATGTLSTVLSVIQAAPLFLGKESPRTFTIVVTSPKTKGLLGGTPVALGKMVTRNGTVSVNFSSSQLDPSGAAKLELVLTPDFQEGAKRASRIIDDNLGYASDGIISLDTNALAALVALTGPIQLETDGAELTADNVAAYLNVGQFKDDVATATADKTPLVAQMVFDKLKESRDLALTNLAKALGPAVLNGNVQLWFPEFAFSKIATGAQGLGEFTEPKSIVDFALLARTSVPGLDSFVTRETTVDTKVDRAGQVETKINVTLSNESSVAGSTTYSFYSLTECKATVDGKKSPLTSSRRLLWNVTTVEVKLPATKTSELALVCTGSSSREGLNVGEPRFRGQPSAAGDTWRIAVTSPDGKFVYDGTVDGNRWLFINKKK